MIFLLVCDVIELFCCILSFESTDIAASDDAAGDTFTEIESAAFDWTFVAECGDDDDVDINHFCKYGSRFVAVAATDAD